MTRETVCAHELVEATAFANPDAIAVIAGAAQLSYGELNRRANQLAHFLRAHGVGPDVLVALCLRRTAELLVGILGILKAGGAYVPMDPSYPAERLSLMIEDSHADILLTTADLASSWSILDVRVVRLDADWPIIANSSGENPRIPTSPQNLAYVIYTSGSTGRPKGVMVPHTGLVNYLLWAAEEYGPEARRSALVHSSISFDLTITGLLTPLLVGGRVELLAESDGIDGLLAALRNNEQYGLVKITPAHLDLLSSHLDQRQVASAVGLFVIGGENLEAEKLRFWRKFAPNTRLINEYGPTETVVGCCIYEVRADDPDSGSVPIGKPIANTTLYVLDDKMSVVPIGATGELYIGGAGVARGYLNLPKLTMERFVPDPFAPTPDARMYKTGDLVRYREPGGLEYLGRLDDQIKLRGYRIELGELETLIAEHPGVRQSAAKLVVDQAGNKRLACYVVPQKNQSVTSGELREFLQQKVPQYMVPSSILFLDSLPLTINGKIDRGALPLPNVRMRDDHTPFVRASNGLEIKLVSLFEELFGLENVSLADDFFDLGGDSLLMIELLMRIETGFDKKLSMATLFEAPKISQLAVALQNEVPVATEILPIQPAGSLPPFFCIGAGPLFRPLANRLGSERPFLGVAPNLQRTMRTVEDMAAASRALISQYQKEGPYYLGGWSASGVVAYEVAQQLRAKGEDVDFLGLFDVKNPHNSVPTQARRGERYLNKARFWASELKALELTQLPKYLGEKTKEARRKLRQAAAKANLGPERDLVQAATAEYKPLPYNGSTVFFNAESRPEGLDWDFSLGWKALVTGAFNVHEIPGNHRSMLSEPNVAYLAEKMSMYLVNNRVMRSMYSSRMTLSTLMVCVLN